MIRGVYSSFARCATRGKQTATGPLARRYARSRARPSLANWNVLALGSRQLISRRCLQKRSSKAFWARAPPERPPPPPPFFSPLARQRPGQRRAVQENAAEPMRRGATRMRTCRCSGGAHDVAPALAARRRSDGRRSNPPLRCGAGNAAGRCHEGILRPPASRARSRFATRRPRVRCAPSTIAARPT